LNNRPHPHTQRGICDNLLDGSDGTGAGAYRDRQGQFHFSTSRIYTNTGTVYLAASCSKYTNT